MSIAAVREAFAAALDGIDGLRASAYLTDQINPPQAMVDFEIPEYDLTFNRGADQYDFTVWIFDQRTSERGSQLRMDAWRDPSDADSLKQVIEADAGILAVCDYARVRSVSSPRDMQVGNVHYLVIEFRVEVVISQ